MGHRDLTPQQVAQSIHSSDFLLPWAAMGRGRAFKGNHRRFHPDEPVLCREAAENPRWKRQAVLGSRREVAASAGRGRGPGQRGPHPLGCLQHLPCHPCRCRVPTSVLPQPGHGASRSGSRAMPSGRQGPGTCGNAGAVGSAWPGHFLAPNPSPSPAHSPPGQGPGRAVRLPSVPVALPRDALQAQALQSLTECPGTPFTPTGDISCFPIANL